LLLPAGVNHSLKAKQIFDLDLPLISNRWIRNWRKICTF